MSRLDDLDRRTRVALGATLGFVGVLLLVLGWYLISGEAIAAKQLPYLASASIPGAVLVVCGFVLTVSGTTDPDTARKIAELHALLTEAVAEPAGRTVDRTAGQSADEAPDRAADPIVEPAVAEHAAVYDTATATGTATGTEE